MKNIYKKIKENYDIGDLIFLILLIFLGCVLMFPDASNNGCNNGCTIKIESKISDYDCSDANSEELIKARDSCLEEQGTRSSRVELCTKSAKELFCRPILPNDTKKEKKTTDK